MRKLTAIIIVIVVALYPLMPHRVEHVAAATDVVSHSTLPTNLVAYWSLEEASGTRVDAVGTGCGGSGCDLTDRNTVTQVTDGAVENAADFEASVPEYLDRADHADLSFTADFSLMGWVRWEPTPGTQSMVGKYGAGADRSYNLFLDGGSIKMSGLFGGSIDTWSTTWSPSAETWYHLAFTYDDAAITTNGCFYVDGSLQNSCVDMNDGGTTDGGSTFNLGQRGNSSVYHDGELDEWGAWNKTLSSSEVSDHYNGGTGIPYDCASSSHESCAADEPETMMIIISYALREDIDS